MAAEKHVKEVLSVMLNQPLDVFDLKKIQVNATKAELETDGKLQRRQVPVEKLGEYVPVQRDPINLIKLTEAKMIPELLLCVSSMILVRSGQALMSGSMLMERYGS